MKLEREFAVTIRWGSGLDCDDPDDSSNDKTYTFSTPRDLEMFLDGVDEGCGWLDYRILGVE